MKKENLSRYDSEVWSDNSKNCGSIIYFGALK